MKTNLPILPILGVIAASLFAGCQQQHRTQPSDRITSSNATYYTFTGTIIDIDYADREMTLKDSQGRTETFVMGKQVQRFNEAKVGDKVSVDYYLGYNAEVRKPTPEEAQNPLVVTEAVSRTGPEADPAGTRVRRIRSVVTIEGIDKAAQTITVKGPRGRYWVARVAVPSRLDQVQIGDTIVLEFTESTAIALKPAGE
jgi:hypothetical protein